MAVDDSCAPAEVGIAVVGDGAVRVTVRGRLDGAAADELTAAFLRLLGDRPRRLELDLTAVTDVTPGGVEAVTSCLAIGRRFEEGVGVTVANDVGRRALLESMAGV